jgi:VanZ family protein
MKRYTNFIYYIPAVTLCAGIFFMSSLASFRLPDMGFNWQDKLFHCLAYFVLGLSIVFIFDPNKTKNKTIFILTLFIGSLYGASDEFHQYFVPGRVCDVYDWVADSTGILLSLLFLKKIHKLRSFVSNIIKGNNE